MERERYLELYQQMVQIRLIEEQAAQLYHHFKGKSGGILTSVHWTGSSFDRFDWGT